MCGKWPARASKGALTDMPSLSVASAYVRERSGFSDDLMPADAAHEGNIIVAVAIDGRAAGALVLANSSGPKRRRSLPHFGSAGSAGLCLPPVIMPASATRLVPGSRSMK